MKTKNLLIPVLLGSFLVLVVGGCANQIVKEAYPAPAGGAVKGAAIGAVAGAAASGLAVSNGSAPLGMLAGAVIGTPIGSYYDSEGAIGMLRDLGVTGVRLGDVVEVVIFADLLFDGNESEIRLSAYPMMNKIVDLLKQYGNANMAVMAYSDDIGSTFSQLALTRSQAQSVTTYLWTHGIHLQRMDFYGMGHEETAASERTITGSGYNRRIEITLWSETVPGPLNALLMKKTEDCWMKDDPVACTNAAGADSSGYLGHWDDP